MDEPTTSATEGRDPLAGPRDEDLVLTGPGDEVVDPASLDAASDLPGGVDHTTAAVGAGSLGIALLGLAGVLRRRRDRRRREQLDG